MSNMMENRREDLTKEQGNILIESIGNILKVIGEVLLDKVEKNK